MKSLKVNIHSFVDVITNSSTEIYMWATNDSVEVVKDIINVILRAANSDKTADDLFDIKVIPSEDRIYEMVSDYMDEHNLDRGIKQHRINARASVMEKIRQPDYTLEDTEDSYGRPQTQLAIEPKPGVEVAEGLAKQLERIFEMDAEYNG